MVRDPEPEPDPDDPERAAKLRQLWRLLQAGGIVFLAVVSLGLLPTILSASWPAAARVASVAVWFVAPAIVVALLVVAVVRLRR